MVYLEILFVLLLTLINGVLAMSEMAMVSSRRARLERAARSGSRGARVALRLIEDPSRFLSTVQIGITLVGILAGAVSGATLADRLGDWLDTYPALAGHGDNIAIGMVVVAITFLSLILGELVPKRIALGSPERVASLVAQPMHVLSRLASPAVWLLKTTTESVLGLLGLRDAKRAAITEDEVRALIAEGTREGIFVPQEREMIDGVMRLADRTVRSVMTPRSEIMWLDLQENRESLMRRLETVRFSRLPVCRGTVDHAVGVVHTKDLLPAALRGEPFALVDYMTPALVVHDGMPVLKLLDRFRIDAVHVAIVVDEYGTTRGLVTLTDILEAIAGDLPERGDDPEPMIVLREDGSWLVDGAMPVDELQDRLGHAGMRHGSYSTLAGFVLHRLGRLPAIGEQFSDGTFSFEVVDMDGRRIDKVAVRRLGEESTSFPAT